MDTKPMMINKNRIQTSWLTLSLATVSLGRLNHQLYLCDVEGGFQLRKGGIYTIQAKREIRTARKDPERDKIQKMTVDLISLMIRRKSWMTKFGL